MLRIPSRTCHIAAAEPGDAKGGEQALILTISSMVFRLLLVLRFDDTESTRAYFKGEASGRSFEEACLEIGSLCCGAVNQELLQVFPDLGMSTPYAVSARCASTIRAGLRWGRPSSRSSALPSRVRTTRSSEP